MTLTLMWPAVGAAVAFAAVAAAAAVVVVVVVGVVVVADRVAAGCCCCVTCTCCCGGVCSSCDCGLALTIPGLLRSLFCVCTYWDVLKDNNVVLGVFAVYNLRRSNGLKYLHL